MNLLTILFLLLSAFTLSTAVNSDELASSLEETPVYVQFDDIKAEKCKVSFLGSPDISLTNVKPIYKTFEREPIYKSFDEKLKLEDTSKHRLIDSISFNGFIINQEATELIDIIICETCTYNQKTVEYNPQVIQNEIDNLNTKYKKEKNEQLKKGYNDILKKSLETVESFKEKCEEFNKINGITDRKDLLTFFDGLDSSYSVGTWKPSIYFCKLIWTMFERKITNIKNEINRRIALNESSNEIQKAITPIFYKNIDNVLDSFGLKGKFSADNSDVEILEDKEQAGRPVSIFALQSLICDFMERHTKKNVYLKKYVDSLIENSDYFQKQFEDIIKKPESVDIDTIFKLVMEELKKIILRAETLKKIITNEDMLIEVKFQSCTMEKGWNANSSFLKVDTNTKINFQNVYENTVTINGRKIIIKVTKVNCDEKK